MGQFSWLTSDTGEQVFCQDPKETVYVPIPKEFQDLVGTDCLVEPNYDGYGHFGGRDIYALVAIWNLGADKFKNQYGIFWIDDKIRKYGIDIACYDEDNFKLKYPIKIVSCKMPYEKAEPSPSDPDQGWHTEALKCPYCGSVFSTDAYYEGDECPDCREGFLRHQSIFQ